MAKINIMYRCKDCGNTFSRKPMGKCASCDSFQNFEEIENTSTGKSAAQAGLKSSGAKKPVKKAYSIDELNSSPIQRTATGIGELDRVLGGGFVDSEVVLFAGQPGSGKALSAGTLIPTLSGIKTMESVKVGDTIFDENGIKTKILAKFNPNIDKAYNITFSNGEKINACEDHLWSLIDIKASRLNTDYISKPIIMKNNVKEIFLNEVWNYATNQKLIALNDLTKKLSQYSSLSFNTSLQSIKSTAAAASIKSIYIDGSYYYPVDLISKIESRIIPDKYQFKGYKNSLIKKVVSTKEIFESGLMFENNRKRWCVESSVTITDNIELPYDPYVFGLWLGDGESDSGRLGGAIDDMKIYCDLSEFMNVEKIKPYKNKSYGNLTIGKKRNEFRSFLKENNLLNNKHIPEIFLIAGTEQRRELLRGLMDTDGYAEKNISNGVGISLSNERLINDTKRLISSLGHFVKIQEKQPKKHGKPYGKLSYSINFQTNFDCFKLPRKLMKLRKNFSKKNNRLYITKIDEVEVSEEYYCLMVDSPNKTFKISESWIPTHNSTLSLLIAEKFAEKGHKVLYSSGEESEHQIGLRAKRMNVSNEKIKIVNETNLETLLGHIDEEKPKFLVVDSLQTLASTEINGSIGSVQQSKEAAHTLTRLAKKESISMVLINQIVKSGEFSGSEAIQHIVDATLMLESDSDTPLKFLRATKNRFGDTTEVGVFQHAETGLEEVSDPSGVLMDNDNELLAGTALSFISEGVRQIPVEVQALVTTSNLPTPRKQFNGINYNRGQIVCAILDKFCKAKLYDNDVFVNTVSGIKVNDPLADLATAAAILSSIEGKTLQNTPEPIITGTKRVPSSFVQIISSRGASVSIF